jgi:hypothetical protein
MIALLIGTLALAGVALGWYGYRASVRIAVWGRNMDECDRIFQTMEEQKADVEFPKPPRRTLEDVGGDSSGGGQHRHSHVHSSKMAS